MQCLAAQSDVRPRAGRNASFTSALKFWYLPVANGGLAALPNGAINGDLRLAKIVFHGASLGASHPDAIRNQPVAALFDERGCDHHFVPGYLAGMIGTIIGTPVTIACSSSQGRGASSATSTQTGA